MSLLVMNQNPKIFTKIQATLKKLMKSNLTYTLCKKCVCLLLHKILIKLEAFLELCKEITKRPKGFAKNWKVYLDPKLNKTHSSTKYRKYIV